MKNFDLDQFGGANVFHWDHEHLVRVLTSGNSAVVTNMYLKNAIRKVRRDDFVPEEKQFDAFKDSDIELGYDEQLDKPTVVAKMLDLLKPKLGGRYLDVGTGSGWAAALLGFASGEDGDVITVERRQFMVDLARYNLAKYPNLKNVKIIFADGSKGIPDFAPYDGIHVAAAFEQIPPELIHQLKIRGRLVAPTLDNDIRLIERVAEDEYDETSYEGFYFKPIAQGVV